MASWGTIFALTLRGRVAVSNAMVYSRFRYWAQTMLMPDEILGWLSEDIHELIWSKDPTYKSGQQGIGQNPTRTEDASAASGEIEERPADMGSN